MDRIFGTLEIRAVDEEQRIVEGVANTASLDSFGTIIEPRGARFRLPIPLLWQHRKDDPVGEVIHAEVSDTQIRVRARIPLIAEPGPLRDLTDRAWQAVKYGLVRGFSIGFAKDFKSRGNRVTEWQWRELSLVTLPSNQEATILAVRSAYLAASGETPSPGVSGTRREPIPTTPRRPMKTYAERIAALEATRAANVARMEALSEAAEQRGETKDETEQEEFDTLRDQTRAIDRELVDVRELEKMNRAAATPVGAPKTPEEASKARGGVTVGRPVAYSQPGVGMARLVRAIGLSHKQHRDIETVTRALYPDDALILRAAVGAHNTTTDSALVSDEGGIYADFVEYLRPMTIIGKFGTNGVPSLRRVPFRTPLITQATGGSGYWVGEGLGKPVTKFTWTRTTIEPLKVANIAVITDELLRSSSPSADANIRDALVEALRERLDTDFIDPDKAASAGVSPASITNGVSATTSSGTDADAVSTDVQAAMAGFIAANNAPTTGVWIMSATRALALSMMRNALGQLENPGLSMAGGTFAGLPVIVSEYVDTDQVYLVNASDIYLADEGGFAVDSSTEASLQMDDSPTQDSVTPTASTLVSMFQTNSVAIRAERTINWAKRRASAVQVLDAVYWGGTAPST